MRNQFHLTKQELKFGFMFFEAVLRDRSNRNSQELSLLTKYVPQIRLLEAYDARH